MFTKKQYKGVGLSEKEEFGQFVNLRGRLGKKEWCGDFVVGG